MRGEYTFRGQRENEDVLLVIKKNVWVFVKTGLVILVLANLAVFALILLGASGYFSYILLILVVTVGFLVGFKWYEWMNSIYIITSQRVIKMDQQGLFHRIITEAELDRISDVTTDVKGPIATFMNFGVIHIDINGSETGINLTAVTDAYDVSQQIVKVLDFKKDDIDGKIEMRDNFGGDYDKSVKKFE